MFNLNKERVMRLYGREPQDMVAKICTTGSPAKAARIF